MYAETLVADQGLWTPPNELEYDPDSGPFSIGVFGTAQSGKSSGAKTLAGHLEMIPIIGAERTIKAHYHINSNGFRGITDYFITAHSKEIKARIDDSERMKQYMLGALEDVSQDDLLNMFANPLGEERLRTELVDRLVPLASGIAEVHTVVNDAARDHIVMLMDGAYGTAPDGVIIDMRSVPEEYEDKRVAANLRGAGLLAFTCDYEMSYKRQFMQEHSEQEWDELDTSARIAGAEALRSRDIDDQKRAHAKASKIDQYSEAQHIPRKIKPINPGAVIDAGMTMVERPQEAVVAINTTQMKKEEKRMILGSLAEGMVAGLSEAA